MGSLDVFGKTTGGDWMLFKLSGKLKGHQGKYWKHAEFNIGGPSKRYWVMFIHPVRIFTYTILLIFTLLKFKLFF